MNIIKKLAASVLHTPAPFYLLLILTGIYYLPLWQLTHNVDDAFICLRVADNILIGAGWSFNIGEAVNPCSSPLYAIMVVLLVGALRLVEATQFLQNIPSVLFVVSLIFLCASVFCSIRQQFGVIEAFLASLLISSQSFFYDVAGMESALFLGLICLSVTAYVAGAYSWAGLLCGLVFLVRPDGLVLVFFLMCIASYKKNGPAIGSIASVFVLTVLPWLLFSWIYFGDWLPLSARAKSAHLSLFGYHPLAFLEGAIHNAIPYRWQLPVILLGAYWCIKNRNPFIFIVVSFSILQLVALMLLGASAYPWYFAPLVLSVQLLFFAGIIAIHDIVIHFRPESRRVPITLLSAILLTGVWKTVELRQHIDRPSYRFSNNYIAISRWLNNNAVANSHVMTTEIGYIGFFSKQPIIDPLGLIHPQALAEMKKGNHGWWFDETATDIKRPKYIVTQQNSRTKRHVPLLNKEQVIQFSAEYTPAFESGLFILWEHNEG